MCVYFLLDIAIPPDVVLLFFYIRGLLSIVRFCRGCSSTLERLFYKSASEYIFKLDAENIDSILFLHSVAFKHIKHAGFA